MERCKHGLTLSTCVQCSTPSRQRISALRSTSTASGLPEIYRGFTIYYTPPPERVWSFRATPDAPLEPHRSAFQARRAIDILVDGFASSPTPRRDSSATSVPRQQPLAGNAPRSAPNIPHPLGAADDELGRLLSAESVRVLAITLPKSGDAVGVRAYQRKERRYAGELPANFRSVPNKVAVDWNGTPVYPEFAIIRRLEALGWQATWRKNWHGAAFWHDIGVASEMPASVLRVFNSIAGVAGAGAWDILAWKGDRIMFIESKQYGSDKLTPNQLRWLETALNQGVPIDSFVVFEYRA